jgi:hypothetical protein
MFGFARTRSNLKGKINTLAYLGMTGDVVVVLGLYTLYKYNQQRKLTKLPELKQKAREEAL